MLYVSWQLDPVLIGGLVALVVSYGLLVGPLRKRIAPQEPFPTRHALVFAAGLVLFYLVEGSPLHDLAERYLLVAHMLQHVGVSYLVAPILIAGVPAWMWRSVLLNRPMRPISKVLFHPVVAFAAFTIYFDVWHIPAIYVTLLSNTSLHHLGHLLLLAFSVMLWWPIMSPLKELPKLPYLMRLAYLFLLPVGQLPVFGMITFAGEPLYSTYANMPVRAFGIGVLEDQALGGIAMKVTGLFAFGIPFIVIFFQWYRREMLGTSNGGDLGLGDAAIDVVTPTPTDARSGGVA